MKTPANIMKVSLAAAILALLAFNPASRRCEPPPTGPSEATPPQASQDHPRAAIGEEDRDQRAEKSQRFKELEALIAAGIMIQYQRLDDIPDLRPDLD